MNYDNHVVSSGGAIMAVEDNVFTVYADHEGVLDNWLKYFGTSDTWREEHLKTPLPFINMSESPYRDTAEESVSVSRYDELLEVARAMPHRSTIVVDDGEEGG